MPAPRIESGSIIDKRYRVIRPLGRGGMGAVYEVENIKKGTRHALKTLLPELATSEKALARFEREVDTAKRLDHKNIVTLENMGRHNGVPYFVMEMLEGQSLRAAMKTHGSFTVSEAWNILKPVCAAMQYAHAQGLIHRDISPENIFICNDGAVKLLDFGLAHEEDAKRQLTRTGASLGKLVYMAPEQLRDSKSVDARADIYSIGVVLFEMLTGEQPIGPQTARQLNPSLPRKADALLASALAARDDRLNLQAFRDQLQSLIGVTMEERGDQVALLLRNAAEGGLAWSDRLPSFVAAPIAWLSSTVAGSTTQFSPYVRVLLVFFIPIAVLVFVYIALSTPGAIYRAVANGPSNFSEPDPGLLATEMNIEGSPAIDLTLEPTEPVYRVSGEHFFMFSPDNRYILCHNASDNIQLYEAGTGNSVYYKEVSTEFHDIEMTSDGSRFVTAADNGTVTVWDTQSGDPLYSLTAHRRSISALAITPDDATIVTASADRNLNVWDMYSGSWKFTLQGHSGPVNVVEVTPDSRRAISTSYDGALAVWNLEAGQLEYTLTGHVNTVIAVCIVRGGSRAVSIEQHGALIVWDLDSATASHRIETDRYVGRSEYFKLTSDGRYALIGGSNDAQIWDIIDGVEVVTLVGRGGMFCNNDTHVIAYPYVYDFIRREQTQIILYRQAGQSYVRNIAISPDGQLAAIGLGRDSDVVVFPLEN